MHNALHNQEVSVLLTEWFDFSTIAPAASLPISMKKKETLNFRVSPEFKRRLTAEARKERRSITNYVETTLTVFWEQQEEKHTVKPKNSDGGGSKNL